MGGKDAGGQDAASGDAYNGSQGRHLLDHGQRVVDKIGGREKSLGAHGSYRALMNLLALMPHGWLGILQHQITVVAGPGCHGIAVMVAVAF